MQNLDFNIFKKKKYDPILDGEKVSDQKFYKIVNNIQDEIVSFCRDYYLLHDKSSFFGTSFTSQMDFNNCVSYSTLKVKEDTAKIDNFYSLCIKEGIKKNICESSHESLYKQYSNYMINQKGVYIEFVDFEQYIDK
jgi:hypothetical protein